MPANTQARRLMAVTTPLGPDALLLEKLSGAEAISELYEYTLDLLAVPATAVPFERVLGQPLRVDLHTRPQGGPPGPGRFVTGIVSRFTQGGELRTARGEAFVRYRAVVVPRLWLLTRRSQSRIFQHQSVPDILKSVLDGLDVAWHLAGKFDARDYCVQYRESDFAFASRLMEEEGIFYYFEHAAGSHRLVVANHPQSHPPVPGPGLIYETVTGGNRPEDRVTGWSKSQQIRTGRHTLWDHCFELPGENLEAAGTVQRAVQVGAVLHPLGAGGGDQLEAYDYPGRYAQRYDGVDAGGGDRSADVRKIAPDSERTAGLRAQEEAARGVEVAGESACRQLTAGHTFTLQRHFNANGEYLLTRVEIEANLAGEYRPSGGVGGGIPPPPPTPGAAEDKTPPYTNRFTAMPKGLPFRPARVTPRPQMVGTQTAVVVGPAGEEIFTDKYGRVKVQFPWDRAGRHNADSSCWVRVAQMHAGKRFGGIDIPRVGQEVVVAFEEGDPDRPLVIGRVYNAGAMPPFDLPAKRMVSGLKSNTYPGGGGNNEISMDDSKGKELMFVNAQFDQTVNTNHDRATTVGNDSKESVGRNVTEFVGNDQSETITNNLSTTAGNKIVITAGTSITLKCGASMIHMNQAGFITITGTVITVAAAANLAMAAPLTEVVGGVMLSAVGGLTLIEGGVTHVGGAKLVSVTSGGQLDLIASTEVVAKAPLIKLNG